MNGFSLFAIWDFNGAPKKGLIILEAYLQQENLPMVGRGGTPALMRMPGQTVYSHLFTIVNVVERTPDVNSPSMVNRDTNNDASNSQKASLCC
ncbi:hypothetical protein PRUPE_6G203600 [Prunus persica]|uniref:Uncharacterized protein n=1 Tax=Prunus persica TaxID=3760 RepID=A0A251NT75_PRUPE|nr:hypothetical protein PRUPE_6G203600 [Prunus persica]